MCEKEHNTSNTHNKLTIHQDEPFFIFEFIIYTLLYSTQKAKQYTQNRMQIKGAQVSRHA